MNPALREKLRKLPALPGVYFHKNSAGEIIYIGKSAVLKNRVRHYFQNSQKDRKTTALVQEIADTDWIVVDTEMDALFLEAEMVKRYLPKWNVLLRDDKSLNYIRINLKDPVPYLSFTRTPLDDQATYIGPFYAKATVEKALRVLRPIFPYYDKPYRGQKTLNTDLGLTPGLEINKSTPKAYKKNLRNLIKYLSGGREKLLKELEKTMQASARAGNYELAATTRDQLYHLKALKQKIIFSDQESLDLSADQALSALQNLFKLQSPPRRIEGYDISHQSGTNVVASMVVFINGVSAKTAYRKFKITKDQNNDFQNLREVLTRRLKHQDWERPDLILIDGGTPQLRAVQDILVEANIPFFGLAEANDDIVILDHTGLSRKIPNLPQNSHIIKLAERIRDEAHRFALAYHSLLKRKNMLK